MQKPRCTGTFHCLGFCSLEIGFASQQCDCKKCYQYRLLYSFCTFGEKIMTSLLSTSRPRVVDSQQYVLCFGWLADVSLSFSSNFRESVKFYLPNWSAKGGGRQTGQKFELDFPGQLCLWYICLARVAQLAASLHPGCGKLERMRK